MMIWNVQAAEQYHPSSAAVRDPILRLSAAVVLKATQDIQSGEDDDLALDALFWLALDPVCETMLHLLEFEKSGMTWLLEEADRSRNTEEG